MVVLRDRLGFAASDVGDGRLIFDVPEVEIGCHPHDGRPGRLAWLGSRDVSGTRRSGPGRPRGGGAWSRRRRRGGRPVIAAAAHRVREERSGRPGSTRTAGSAAADSTAGSTGAWRRAPGFADRELVASPGESGLIKYQRLIH